MVESWIYAWRQIKRRKLRFFGIAAGYALAAAVIAFLTSAVVSTRDSAVGALGDIGAHAVAYIPNRSYESPPSQAQMGPEAEGACCEEGTPPGMNPEWEGFTVNNAPAALIPEAAVEAIRKSPNVADAAPYLLFRIKAPKGRGEWTLGGFDPARPKAFSATMAAKAQVKQGRFLEPGDNGLVMLEQEFASVYGLAAGDKLEMRGKEYEVAGIVAPPLRPGKANIYMTLTDLRKLVNSTLDTPIEAAANAVLVESKGARFHEAAKADVRAVLGENSRITSYGCYVPGSLAIGIHENTAQAIVLVVVLSMLLLAVKIQCSSVVERGFDIGVLKAIGWSDRAVVSQIMFEAFVPAAAGGLLGCVLAATAAGFVPDLEVGGGAQIGIALRGAALLAGFVVPPAAGLAAGALAAAVAARMRPADILRRL